MSSEDLTMALLRCLGALLIGIAGFVAIGPASAAEQPRTTDLSAIEPAGPMPAQAPPAAEGRGAIGTVLVIVGASLLSGGTVVVTLGVRRLPSRSRRADQQPRPRSMASRTGDRLRRAGRGAYAEHASRPPVAHGDDRRPVDRSSLVDLHP